MVTSLAPKLYTHTQREVNLIRIIGAPILHETIIILNDYITADSGIK